MRMLTMQMLAWLESCLFETKRSKFCNHWISLCSTIKSCCLRHLFHHDTSDGPTSMGVSDTWTFCDVCQKQRPAKAHHCRRCGQCVPVMDHHCPWSAASLFLLTPLPSHLSPLTFLQLFCKLNYFCCAWSHFSIIGIYKCRAERFCAYQVQSEAGSQWTCFTCEMIKFHIYPSYT